jgi:hypothetical protein
MGFPMRVVRLLQSLCVGVLISGWLAPLGPVSSAAEGKGCAAFKWPIEIEQGWFKSASPRATSTGDKLDGPADQALAAKLVANEQVPFTFTPERKPKPGTLGTVLTFAAMPRAGHYQVTLSEDAWIDMIQVGKMVSSYDHSGGPECPGVRKSVRFELSKGPLVLQVSGAASSPILVAIRPID